MITTHCRKCGSGLLTLRYIQDESGAIYRGASELHCEMCGWSDYPKPLASPPPPQPGKHSACNKPRSVEQLDLVTGEVLRTWPSVTMAARAIGVHSSSVHNCCTGKQRQSQGYGFRWAEKEREHD